jgi:NAD(P)-dependent dehydrogenase (short-subunit alcohol dehydrogenase family)
MSKHPFGSYPDLKGKTAVITSNWAGIERELCEAFLQNEIRTVLLGPLAHSAMDDPIGETPSDVWKIDVDLMDPEQMKGAFGQILPWARQVDILINCASGSDHPKVLTDITDREWHRMLNETLGSAFYGCREVLPGMLNAAWGRIINVSSQAATNPPTISATHYAAAEAGILGLTRHTAREYGMRGITCNAIIRGATGASRSEHQNLMSGSPDGLLSEPWTTASAILFLVSNGAGNVNGATLNLTAGRDMT